MLTFADWFPLLCVGLMFTAFGGFKLYGLRHGIVGGRNKPTFQKLCGT